MKRWLAGLLALILTLTTASCDFLKKPDPKAEAYAKALEAYDSKDYEAAIEAFEDLGDYEDSEDYLTKSRYRLAKNLLEKEQYAEAAALLEQTGKYKDSKELLEQAREKLGTVTPSTEAPDVTQPSSESPGTEPPTEPETEPVTEPAKSLEEMDFIELVCAAAKTRGKLSSTLDMFVWEKTNVYGMHRLEALTDSNSYFDYQLTATVQSPDGYRDAELELEYWFGEYEYRNTFRDGSKLYRVTVTMEGDSWRKELTCRDIGQLAGSCKEVDEYGWEVPGGKELWDEARVKYAMEILDGLQRLIENLHRFIGELGVGKDLAQLGFEKLDPEADWGNIGKPDPAGDLFAFYYRLAVENGVTDANGEPYYLLGTDDYTLTVTAREDSYTFVWAEAVGADSSLVTSLTARRNGTYTFNLYTVLPQLNYCWEAEADFDPKECTGTNPKQLSNGKAWNLDANGMRTGEFAFSDYILEMERQFLNTLRETCRGDAFLAEQTGYAETVAIADLGLPVMYYEPEEDTLQAWLFHAALSDGYFDYDYEDWNLEYSFEDYQHGYYGTPTDFCLYQTENSVERYYSVDLEYSTVFGYELSIWISDYTAGYHRQAKCVIDPATLDLETLEGLRDGRAYVTDADGYRVNDTNIWESFRTERADLLKSSLRSILNLAYSLVQEAGGTCSWADMGFVKLKMD